MEADDDGGLAEGVGDGEVGEVGGLGMCSTSYSMRARSPERSGAGRAARRPSSRARCRGRSAGEAADPRVDLRERRVRTLVAVVGRHRSTRSTAARTTGASGRGPAGGPPPSSRTWWLETNGPSRPIASERVATAFDSCSQCDAIRCTGSVRVTSAPRPRGRGAGTRERSSPGARPRTSSRTSTTRSDCERSGTLRPVCQWLRVAVLTVRRRRATWWRSRASPRPEPSMAARSASANVAEEARRRRSDGRARRRSRSCPSRSSVGDGSPGRGRVVLPPADAARPGPGRAAPGGRLTSGRPRTSDRVAVHR